MSTKEARQRATAKYEAKKYDKVLLRLEKGKKEVISQHASSNGESLNGFVNRAIDEAMERDKEKGAVPD